MKLKCSFQIIDMGDEIIAVPVGENSKQVKGIIKLNSEGAEILRHLVDGLNKEQIIEQLTQKYENVQSQLTSYVDSFFQKLKAMGLAND